MPWRPERRPLTRWPAIPSSAGSRVMDASTITSTIREIPMPTGGDERDPGDGETQDRHDDGATGEDDRPAGGGQRAADRVLDVTALGEVLTEPGQR